MPGTGLSIIHDGLRPFWEYPMAQIFISYVQEDSAIALEIAEGLGAAGYSTWYYERDTVPGPSYLLQMGEAIDDADALLLIVSPSSILSNQVTSEVVRGHEKNKPFIPLLHGISHAEFQERAPIWRQALGASTATEMNEDTPSVVSKIVEGLVAYGVKPVQRAGLNGSPLQIIFASELFAHVLEQASAVAATDATVLIEGESGVGKELVARRIHEQSRRHNGPFVKVDCASIPPDRFESEFFGQAAGSLPGVTRDQAGRLENADRGTLFLDRVEEIPAELQVKLLRPLQDATFERLGDGRTRRADVRFIAATNRDLVEKVADGGFRRDLYFRLSVFPIKVPPLRDRPADIAVLVNHFLAENTAAQGVIQNQLDHLQKYDWPGNVRELQNIVERALILSGNGPLRLDEALPSSAISYPARAPLQEEQTPARGFFSASEFEELERNNLVAALELVGWQVAGAEGAAERLGLTVAKLRSRMKALDISRPEPDSLYVRLGGSRGIATFVRDLFGRAVAHPVLGRFWKGRSTYGILREEKLLAAYLSAAAGGPAHYVGRDMQSSHQHLGISRGDWEILETLLSTTLEALSVPDTERRDVIAFVESLRDEIVTS